MGLDVMNLDYIVIDRTSTVPLYEQLRVCISDAIRRGVLRSSMQLPTENEIIESCGVSRQVVRQAYGALVQSGQVIRERGRGTFVKAENYGVFMNKLMSYQEELALSGKVPKTEVLTACRQDTPEELSGPSDLGDSECFYLERLRSADGKASVHIQTYLPYSRFPGIERFDFAALSLYHTLAKEYGIHLRDAKRSLSAENASDREAKLLGVENGKALLLLESHTFDRNGCLVEVSFEHFVGDACHYEFEVAAGR